MIGAVVFLICRELMIEKRLAQDALIRPKMIPLVYRVSNLKMIRMPVIIKIPANISNLDILFLLNNGSNMAVNSVIDERHTNVTGTVDTLMAWKKSSQCPPKSKPVKNNLRNNSRLTAIVMRLNLKYISSPAEAISTLYHTSDRADMEIRAPSILVNPHIKTVKWRIIKFLLMPSDAFNSAII